MYVLRQNPTKYIDTITFQSTEEVLRRSIDNQGASKVYARHQTVQRPHTDRHRDTSPMSSKKAHQ